MEGRRQNGNLSVIGFQLLFENCLTLVPIPTNSQKTQDECLTDEISFPLFFSGLGTQLVRQIPNTAIMMATYEAVVYVLTTHFNSEFYA